MTETTENRTAPEGGTPGGVSSDTPGRVSSDTPGGVSCDTPGGVSGDTPSGVNSDTPGEVNSDTPGRVSGGTADKKSAKKLWFALYSVAIVLLLATSFSLNLLGLIGAIDLEAPPYFGIDLAITALLWVEYLTRLFLCPRKGEYFKENILELVSILPYSPALGVLHLVRLLHFLRFFEMIGSSRFWAKLKQSAPLRFWRRTRKRIAFFFNERGFLYGLYAFLLLFLSLGYATRLLEEIGYFQALAELLRGAALLCLKAAPTSLFAQIDSGLLFSLFCALLVWLLVACRAHAARLFRLKAPIRRLFGEKTV